MKKIFGLLVILSLTFTNFAMSQSQSEDFVKNTQNDLLIVAGAGGAGAILGLSTLSFVDMPSNHLRNVWTGAAVGMIAGVIFVAYNSAQRGSEELQSSAHFNTSERVTWHFENDQKTQFDAVLVSSPFWEMNF
jgi:hypothetical protein